MSPAGRAAEPTVWIVTPCPNASRFIERTTRRVLAQDHASTECLVMAGGSADGTLQIPERYRPRLDYVSGPDAGQADAVNRGFARTTGEILGLLNAVQTYESGAVAAAVNTFAAYPDAAAGYGETSYVDEHGRPISPYPVEPFYCRAVVATARHGLL